MLKPIPSLSMVTIDNVSDSGPSLSNHCKPLNYRIRQFLCPSDRFTEHYTEANRKEPNILYVVIYCISDTTDSALYCM